MDEKKRAEASDVVNEILSDLLGTASDIAARQAIMAKEFAAEWPSLYGTIEQGWMQQLEAATAVRASAQAATSFSGAADSEVVRYSLMRGVATAPDASIMLHGMPATEQSLT